MYTHSNKIAVRYLRILTSIAEMAENGELVSDLSHSAVRACVLAMQADEAEPIDVYHIFGDGLREQYQEVPAAREKHRAVLESAFTHMVFMLLQEESVDRDHFPQTASGENSANAAVELTK